MKPPPAPRLRGASRAEWAILGAAIVLIQASGCGQGELGSGARSTPNRTGKATRERTGRPDQGPETHAASTGDAARSPEYWLRQAKREIAGIENEAFRTAALTSLATAWEEIGNTGEALGVVKEAKQEQEWREKVLGVLALARAEKGQFEEAIRIARNIKTKAVREESLVRVSQHCARKGKLSDGLKIAKGLSDLPRTKALAYMVQALLRRGNPAGARKALNLIPDIDTKQKVAPVLTAAEALAEGKSCKDIRQKLKIKADDLEAAMVVTAVARAHASKPGEAMTLIRKMTHALNKGQSCVEGARALLDRGQRKEAASMLEWGLTHGQVIEWRADEVTAIQLATGTTVGARKVIQARLASLKDWREFPSRYNTEYTKLVESMLELGDLEAAKKMAEQRGPERSVLFRKVFARYYARHARFRELKTYLKTCKTPVERALAYTGVALGLAEALKKIQAVGASTRRGRTQHK